MPGNLVLSRRLRITVALMVVAVGLLSCKLFTRSDPASSLPPAPTAVPSTATSIATAVSPTLAPAPTQTPIPVSTQAAGQVEALDYLYTQDFSSHSEEWDIDPYENDRMSVVYQIKGGVFTWQVQSKEGTTVWNVPDPAVTLPDGDFLYTISLEFGPANGPAAAGAVFRMQDKQHFYYAKLTDTGMVSVFANQDGKWTRLVEPVQSDHFRKNKTNRLIVVDEDGTYEVQVNDYPVVSFTDRRYRGGNIGLIVDLEAGIQSVVIFDDVRVMQPSSSGAGMDEEAGRPTLMPLGASYQTFTGKFQGMPYSIDHPFVFVHSQSGGWERLCLDAPEELCVSLQAQKSRWDGAEAMAGEIITAFSSSVSDYSELHRQSTVTVEGLPAYWVGYTYTRNGKTLEGSRLFVVAGKAGFEIAAEGEPVMMDLYRVVIKKMLESFRLKEY